MRVENDIESAVGANLKKWLRQTGIWGEYLKLSVLGFRGWPDRLIVWEGGNVLFIEFKQPGEEPRALQVYVHEKLRKMGFTVEVHDDRAIALDSIKAKIRASVRASSGDEAYSHEQGQSAIPPARERKDRDRP